MKQNKNTSIRLKSACFLLLITSVFFGCQPDVSNPGLGAKPTPDFVATLASDGHSVLLKNKTALPSMLYWSVPDLNLGYADLKGDSVKLNFIFPGTYSIKLLAVGAGGLDSITKTITTTQPDSNACSPSTALGFIASCTSKVWKMNPAPLAFKVGQFSGEGGWWSSGAQEVIDRPCAFNDTYTFTFNKARDFVFDDKGDFFSDGYIGINPTTTCQPSSQYTAAQRPWGSGNFKFVVIPGTGVKGLGQLKLIGLGAHIGIQKAYNNNDSFTVPTATSVTYDIWSMQHISDASGTYDLLTLTIHYGNWSPTEGWWTFTLRSY